jgi:hypothetical protein
VGWPSVLLAAGNSNWPLSAYRQASFLNNYCNRLHKTCQTFFAIFSTQPLTLTEHEMYNNVFIWFIFSIIKKITTHFSPDLLISAHY